MFTVVSYPTWYSGNVYSTILPYLITRTCFQYYPTPPDTQDVFTVLSYPTWYLGRVYSSILPYLIPRTCFQYYPTLPDTQDVFTVLSYPTWYLGRVYSSILPYLIPRTCLIWLVITWKDAPTVKELTTVSVRTMERNPSLPIPAISWINPGRKCWDLLKELSPCSKGNISEKSFYIIFFKIFSLSIFSYFW